MLQNSGPSGTIKTKILKVGDVERVGMVPTCFVGTEGPNISMTGLVEVAVSSLRVETRKVIAIRCEEATVYTAATTNGRVITEPFGLCSDHVVAWCNLLKKRGMVHISYQSRCLVANIHFCASKPAACKHGCSGRTVMDSCFLSSA